VDRRWELVHAKSDDGTAGVQSDSTCAIAYRCLGVGAFRVCSDTRGRRWALVGLMDSGVELPW
jgi:hypothetical protein